MPGPGIGRNPARQSIRPPAPAVNVTAVHKSGNLPDQQIVRTVSCDAVEIRDIYRPGADSPDVPHGIRSRGTAPVEGHIGFPVPGLPVHDQILLQIHCQYEFHGLPSSFIAITGENHNRLFSLAER